MAYRNKVYVSFDADNDMQYYRTLQMWDANAEFEFTFNDVHQINTILDKSEQSIKAGLLERFRNTKVFVLLIGNNTKNLYKYVRWEIDQAIKREIPIIAVNINGKRNLDNELCPAILKNALAVHVPFKQKIIYYALNNWPTSDLAYRKNKKTGPFYYKDQVYKELGL